MFAIVKIGGKQYKVSQGDVLKIERQEGDVGKHLEFSDVLLLQTEGSTFIGTPYVPGAVVVAKIIAQIKGDKLYVYRFRAKSRYRRKKGFRPIITKIEIESVGSRESRKRNVKSST